METPLIADPSTEGLFYLPEETQAFLIGLLAPLPADSAVEVRTKGAGGVRSRFVTSIASIPAEFDQHERVWFGVSLRKKGATTGTLADLTWASCIWADWDNVVGKDDLIRGLKQGTGGVLVPSFIVDSGGGLHAYWRIDRMLDLRDETQVQLVREVVYGLARILGSDPTVHDPTRVMGLPGSWNAGNGRNKVYDPPRQVRVLHAEPKNRYSVSDLARYRQPITISPDLALPVLPDPTDDPVILRIPPKLVGLVREGWHKGCGYESRSELDMALIVAMLAAGHSLQDIVNLFDKEQIGDKVRDKGSDGRRYLAQTVASAQAWLACGQAPDEYRATEDGLVWMKPGTSGIRLTNFTARVLTEVAHDDGAEVKHLWEIEGHLGDRVARITITPEEFATMEWAAKHLGPRAIVSPGFGMKEHARVAIQSLSSSIVDRRVYGHTGWRRIGDDWCYLYRGGAVGRDGVRTDLTVSLPDALSPFVLTDPAGEEVEAVRASLRVLGVAPDTFTIPLLASTYRAVLGQSEFSLYLSGRTGIGKSELSALSQQHYGAGFTRSHLPGAWSATANSLEALAFVSKDAVCVIDDWTPTGSQSDTQRLQRDADRIFRGQGNGSGRMRMRADITLRPAKPPRGLVVSSGEDSPTGHSLRARIFVVHVSPDDVRWDVLTHCQGDAASGKYAGAMFAFLRWLAPQFDEIQANRREEIAQLRSANLTDQHKRSVDAVASLLWAFTLFIKFALGIGAVTESEADALRARAKDALEQSSAVQATHQQEGDAVERFLILLRAGLASGRLYLSPSLPDQRGTKIGWREGQDVFLEPITSFTEAQRMAREAGDQLPFTAPTLLRRLSERGFLVSTDQGRHTVRRTLEGAKRRVLHLAGETLGLEGEEHERDAA